METSGNNKRLERFAGILGFVSISLFGVFMGWAALKTGKIEGVSMVSFSMWCCLDILLWVIAKKRGEDPFLVKGWTISTLAVTAMFALLGAPWSFGVADALSVACVLIAALGLCWWQGKPAASYAGGWALYLSGIPQTIASYQTPQASTWWFWMMAATATALSLYAKRGFSKEALFAERLIVFSQVTILLLTVRPV